MIDGDILEVSRRRVRLQGIDAPEKGQSCRKVSGNLYPCGREALRVLRDRVGVSNVSCAIDAQRDRHDQALGARA